MVAMKWPVAMIKWAFDPAKKNSRFRSVCSSAHVGVVKPIEAEISRQALTAKSNVCKEAFH